MTMRQALGMKRVGYGALVMVAMMFARAGCRGAVHEAMRGTAPAHASATVSPPAVEAPVARPRRLLHYENYISADGRTCWLNRANEQVCK